MTEFDTGNLPDKPDVAETNGTGVWIPKLT